MAERDLRGYGGNPPRPHWPGDARIAVSFVLNVEEGAESCLDNGDDRSEAYLHEIPGRPARENERDLSVESLYEYGSRAGAWRVLEIFAERSLPLTVFAAGRALELNPELAWAAVAAGHEVAGHGWRWIDYRAVSEEVERDHIRKTIEIIERLCGRRPVGWYTGRVSANTRRLVREDGGFLYTSDLYDDDLPHWLPGEAAILGIPYTLVNNDARYLWPNGFATGEDFFLHHRDAFDRLRREGERAPKMMSVGLHGRISGHPGRAAGLARFLDHVMMAGDAWVCRREEIARHWAKEHPDG